MTLQRAAVLVDGDNVAAAHAARILAEAGRLGRVDVARVYAAANRPSGWLTAPGFRLIHAGAGKNGADLLLCIDAMELALSETLAVFAVATSDADFTHLAQRLRERGRHVLGLGEAKAPATFRAACTSFVDLGPTERNAAPAATPAVEQLDQQIRAVVSESGLNGKGIHLSALGQKMIDRHRIKKYPGGGLLAYLTARPTLYAVDPPKAMLRLRPEGFAASPATPAGGK